MLGTSKAMVTENDPLEDRAWDYVRAGWTVTSRTTQALTLMKGDQNVRLSRTPDGLIAVDGPEPGLFNFEGRIRAWGALLALLAAAFAVAWALGWFR
jgi:hypothetical protein